MLINFADSAFAIGQSQTAPNLRYLKQIKQLNQCEEYGENNICLISLQVEHNFLHYKFEGHAHERDHLRRPDQALASPYAEKVLELHQKGLSLRQIATEVGIHFSTVGRIVQGVKKEEGKG